MSLVAISRNANTATAQTATTGSVTFVNNMLYVCSLAAHSSSGNIAFVTPVTSGLTWVQVGATNAAVDRVALYCACVASGAVAATTALDTGQANTTRQYWDISSIAGSVATAANNGSDAFGTPGYEQRTTGQTGTSVTLGAFADAVNNMVWDISQAVANLGGIIEESGYTRHVRSSGSGSSWIIEWIIGQDLNPTVTWGTATNPAMAMAVEVIAAASSVTNYVGMLPI